MQAERIDETLIAALYGPAVQEGDWNPALRRFREIMNCFDINLSVFDRATSRIHTESTGVVLTSERRESYIAYYGRLDPKVRIFARREQGFLFNDIAHFDEDFVARDPFYQEYSLPFDSRHTLDMLVHRDPAKEIYLAGMRTRKQGPFKSLAEQVFRGASTHFVCALKLREKLDAAARAGTALDMLNFGIVILDGRGRIALCNRRAEAAFTAGEELQVRQGRLAARRGAVERQLQAALAIACEGTGGTTLLRIPRASGSAWLIWCAPLPASSTFAPQQEPGALLILRDAQSTQGVEARDLAALHGLTPAEADLALALSGGENLQSYARRRGVKLSTARWHLLSVLQKTGASRQSDLVRMVASLNGPLQRN